MFSRSIPPGGGLREGGRVVNWREWFENSKTMKKILFCITYAVLLVFAVFNLQGIRDALGYFVGLIYPFLVGIAMAFVVNVLLKFYEERAFAFLNRRGFPLWLRFRRAVCVFLSLLTLLVYQGGITLLARFIRPWLTDALITQVSCIGSVLIFAIGFNLMFDKKVKVGNLLPAILLPVVFFLLSRFFPALSTL